MSRLDSFIRRLTAQRDCLGLAAQLIVDIPGPVLELGLGNGRTYDHLRELFPAREIFAFDRQLNAHALAIPDPAHLILGEFSATLAPLLARLAARPALAHADFGGGEPGRVVGIATWLGQALVGRMAPGGIVASDQALPGTPWEALPLPSGIAAERYFLYRC